MPLPASYEENLKRLQKSQADLDEIHAKRIANEAAAAERKVKIDALVEEATHKAPEGENPRNIRRIDLREKAVEERAVELRRLSATPSLAPGMEGAVAAADGAGDTAAGAS